MDTIDQDGMESPMIPNLEQSLDQLKEAEITLANLMNHVGNLLDPNSRATSLPEILNQVHILKDKLTTVSQIVDQLEPPGYDPSPLRLRHQALAQLQAEPTSLAMPPTN